MHATLFWGGSLKGEKVNEKSAAFTMMVLMRAIEELGDVPNGLSGITSRAHGLSGYKSTKDKTCKGILEHAPGHPPAKPAKEAKAVEAAKEDVEMEAAGMQAKEDVEMEDDEENTKDTLESEDVGTPVKMYEHARSF